MRNWKCSKCKQPAQYHVSDEKGHKYYCQFHWTVKLGFKQEKKNEDNDRKHKH